MSARGKVGSLFSGVDGFGLGFEKAGFEVAWQVEIDRDCISVLARHWPNTRRYGDVREVADRLEADPTTLEPVDVVVFGSPCQGFSVAAKGDGLADERSALFGEAVRIIRGLRPGPALICWENVPGAFTTGRDSDDPERDVRGRDFAAVLAALANSRALDIAWGVLDSQGVGDCALHREQSGFWAVPQRRRRIFLVADFRAERAAEILALPDRLSRHPAPRRKSRQGSPTDTEVGAGVGSPSVAAFGGNRTSGPLDVATALLAHGGPNGHQDFESETFVVEGAEGVGVADTLRSHPRAGSNSPGAVVVVDLTNMNLSGDGSGVAGTITTEQGHGNRGQFLVAPFDEVQITSRDNRSQPEIGCPATTLNGSGRAGIVQYAPEIASSVTASAGHHGHSSPRGDGADDLVVCSEPETEIGAAGLPVEGDGAFNWQAGAGNDTSFRGKSRQYVERAGDYTGALRANGQDAVAYSLFPKGGGDTDISATETEVSQAITANHGTSQNRRGTHVVEPDPGGWIVRRLTPTECERLQGFPDGWTRYRADGTEIADGPRYRMLGNAVSVTVAYWIACRMLAALGERPTIERMAS